MIKKEKKNKNERLSCLKKKVRDQLTDPGVINSADLNRHLTAILMQKTLKFYLIAPTLYVVTHPIQITKIQTNRDYT